MIYRHPHCSWCQSSPVSRTSSASRSAESSRPGREAGSGEGRRAVGDDRVMTVVRQWHAVHPALGTAPMELIGRLNRSAALPQQAQDAPLRSAGLSRAQFDLMSTSRMRAATSWTASCPAKGLRPPGRRAVPRRGRGRPRPGRRR
ncbi:hypothetical protein SCOCK_300015 [Actinacidiphila cocklensis]|uniref:Uncharacterized protein n=1 Tax=Actinacidiphila cocklensis TaxID=887465 RepID=A0A9W4DS13_9ACTN|nr:hypothetical protein SCOCK_300015 [Actinacidiphila cocklensis]